MTGHWKVSCSLCCSYRTASIFVLIVALIVNFLIFGFSLYDKTIVRYIKPLPDFAFLTTFLAFTTSIVSFYSLVQLLIFKKKTAWLLYFVIVQIINGIFDVFFIIELLRRQDIRIEWDSAVNETAIECAIGSKGKAKLYSLIETTYPETKFVYWLALVTSILMNGYFALVTYSHVREVKEELMHHPADVSPEPGVDKHLTSAQEQSK